MEKDEIIGILGDWNFWEKEIDVGRQREEYLDLCLRFLKPNVVLALTGVRRSGKSYLMRQVARELIAEGKDPKHILIVNFEDRRFAKPSLELLERIYETYLEYFGPSKPFIFLDEIHNVDGWERWVRTLHELGKAKLIVSGSSSKLLSGELATVLTGRHLDVVVFPLDFGEFLEFKNLEIKSGLSVLSKKVEIKHLLREYIEYGGFPEVVQTDEKKQLLLAYFDDILTRDIEKRYKIRKSEALWGLARFYLTNISKPITFNSIRNFIEGSTVTIERFSNYIEEANMVFFLKRFSFSTKEQEKSPRKVYSIDVGLANAVGFRFSENAGRAAENIVAIELKRRCARNPLLEMYYWKDPYGKEVDFVVKDGPKASQLIQVCWDISDPKTKGRELKSLLNASDELKCGNLLVITEDYEGEERAKGRKVTFIPLWKWLLTDQGATLKEKAGAGKKAKKSKK